MEHRSSGNQRTAYVTQYPNPYPQPPFPGVPYAPGRPGPDPRKAARRASVLMWVLGALGVLFGLFMAALLQPMLEWMLANPPPGQEAQVEQLREQLRQVEAHGLSLGTQLLVVGIAITVVGSLMGVLAFFVRGGSRVASVLSAVLTGLVLAYLGFSTLAAIVMSGPQALVGACFMLVPVALMVLLIVWLIQSLRGPRAGAAMAGMPGMQPMAQRPIQSRPSQAAGYDPSPGTPPPGYRAGFSPPAPPPGQPPVQFGYATRPLTPEEPAAPPKDQPPPSQEPPPAGSAA
jgi:hypothetical protein